MGHTACAPALEPICPNLRYNYVAHSIDGGLYMGALTLISAQTVLPSMVRDLNGPNWLVSFMPVMMMLGVMLPPVFTAHLIDRMARFKPLCLATGVFQRIPYLIAGLVLIYWSDDSPRLTIAAVALAPFVSGIVAGISFTGWQQLLLRTLPANKRSSVFAARYLMAAVIGIGAGWVVKRVLETSPGARGYGILYLLAFSLIALSYVVFAMIRESSEPLPAKAERRGLMQNLRAMPEILRDDKRLRLFVLMRIASNGMMIVVPFLAIHARQTLGRGESFIGDLTMASMVGALAGNALAGYLGDRFGGKVVLLLSRIGFLVVAVASAFASSEIAFLLLFVVFGFSFFSDQVGGQVLGLEICPKEHKSTALAVMSFVNLPSMLLATGVSAVISTYGGSFIYLAALAAICIAISLLLLVRISEPRAHATSA